MTLVFTTGRRGVILSPIVTTQLPGSGAILGGDFRIERQLGAGGMGAVYVAEQLSTGRKRALKLMHPSLVSDAKLRERFEQEARVGARIPSDHVVQVIAAGVDESTGSPFIAMELLEGEDLAATIANRGALSPADVQAILQPVCHALGAAHEAGIVHRDLKPENIFLQHTRDVQRSFDVKLLDFGIAKLTADARTMATSAMGTPLWMAPEQTDPRAKIAPPADIWPLGLLAFTMLTGRPYWRVATEQGVSMQALMREILFEPVDAPSVRAVELQIDVPLPVGFDEWFGRCLDREPSRRFATANEAWHALAPVLGAELRPPAQLASLAIANAPAADRARFEAAATAPVRTNDAAMDATMPVSGAVGTDATVDASSLAVAAMSGHATGLSVGKTVPTVTPSPTRSKWRSLGLVALIALVGAGSWKLGTSRANRERHAERELMEHSPEKTPTRSEPSVEVVPSPAPSEVRADAPLSSSSAHEPRIAPSHAPVRSKPAESAKAKLPPFDSIAAQRNADFFAISVKHICSHLTGPGPRAFGVTVTYGPAGKATNTRANVAAPSAHATCAENVLRGSTAPPFDPSYGPGMVAVSISLD